MWSRLRLHVFSRGLVGRGDGKATQAGRLDCTVRIPTLMPNMDDSRLFYFRGLVVTAMGLVGQVWEHGWLSKRRAMSRNSNVTTPPLSRLGSVGSTAVALHKAGVRA
jgi:hypothetical protein